MQKLFCLLLLSNTLCAQPGFFNGDSAVVSAIELPAKEPFDTARAYLRVNNPYVYIISDKDLYDHFGYNTAMKFYKFNFADFHILGVPQCEQCLLFCNHEAGEKNCHRNACRKKWYWFKRDNQKAFTPVDSYTIPSHVNKDLKIYHDTIIAGSSDTLMWHTTGSGDCFARFEYQLVADRYHPVLLLKEWNYWGGCRAAGGKSSTIVFKKPAGNLVKIKRTILMKRE